MKLILLSGILLTLLSFTITDIDIVGLWESKIEKDGIFSMRFRKDSSYQVYINKKSFSNNGKYIFINDTLTIENDFCKDAAGTNLKGVYKLIFSTSDSFRIEVIGDSCMTRRRGAEDFRFGRVTQAK